MFLIRTYATRSEQSTYIDVIEIPVYWKHCQVGLSVQELARISDLTTPRATSNVQRGGSGQAPKKVHEPVLATTQQHPIHHHRQGLSRILIIHGTPQTEDVAERLVIGILIGCRMHLTVAMAIVGVMVDQGELAPWFGG